jgi:hypothetical protein
MIFVMVTGDHLILNTRRFAVYSLIMLGVTAPMTFTMHVVPPYPEYWQIPCFIVSYLVMAVILYIFSNMLQSLFRAATLLNDCFKVRNSIEFYLLGNFIAICVSLFLSRYCLFYIYLGKLFYVTFFSSLTIS